MSDKPTLTDAAAKRLQIIQEINGSNNTNNEDSSANIDDKKKKLIRSIAKLENENAARLYIRVSTAKQCIGGWGLEVQLNILTDFCKRKNLKIVQTYSDEGISAKDYKTRPAMMQLLSEMKNMDTIIAVSLSRISRRARDFTDIMEQISSKGCKLILIDMDIEMDSLQGKLMLGLMAMMAEHEREVISERTRITMNDMSRNGKLTTKPIYGEMVVNGERVKNEQEQKVIEYIRLLVQDNPKITLSEIVRDLTKNIKDPPIRKSKRFYPGFVKRILEYHNIRPSNNNP